MLPVDADSHFFEPLDMFERYIDARFRKRAYRWRKTPPPAGFVSSSIRNRFSL